MSSRTASGILNELAKNNKLILNYNHTEENGPAHQKTFRVNVSLSGLGNFEGFGASIKDAKNAAANSALQFCTLNGMESVKKILKISPTVELNILSMRAREEVIYTELDPVHVKNNLPAPQFQKLIDGKKPHPGHPTLYRQFIKIWKIAVMVLGQTFTGQGKTKQEARNNAAVSALEVARHELAIRASSNVNVNSGMMPDEEDLKARKELAKLNDIASKNKLKLTYDVVSTSGPSHVMKFIITCKTGEHEVVGEGIGKKAAKLDAAKKMLALLLNSENIQNTDKSENESRNTRFNKHPKQKKKKKSRSEKAIDINSDPVTYLTQLLQMRKEPNASYTFLGELGSKLDRKFEIEARIGESTELVATGIGSTKKKAKMNAADNLLKKCGIDREQIQESENEIKRAYLNAVIGRKADDVNCGPVLEEKPPVKVLDRAPGGTVKTRMNYKQNDVTSEMARPTNTQTLELIASSEGIKIIFNDYARKKETDLFTTHLAIVTSPPVVFQGTGRSIGHAHDDAAAQAIAHLNHHGFSKHLTNQEIMGMTSIKS